MSQKPPAAAVSDLAPSGTLRAAINVGKASGFVAKALERHKQTAMVAPAGDAK